MGLKDSVVSNIALYIALILSTHGGFSQGIPRARSFQFADFGPQSPVRSLAQLSAIACWYSVMVPDLKQLQGLHEDCWVSSA